MPIIQTERSQLNTILTDPLYLLTILKQKNIPPQDIDRIAYIDTKLVHIENRFKSSITTLYSNL